MVDSLALGQSDDWHSAREVTLKFMIQYDYMNWSIPNTAQPNVDSLALGQSDDWHSAREVTLKYMIRYDYLNWSIPNTAQPNAVSVTLDQNRTHVSTIIASIRKSKINTSIYHQSHLYKERPYGV